jgi:hypothetical protein
VSYASTVLAESSLVGYWKLDETSGTTAVDSKGSHNGTYLGDFSLAQARPPGFPGLDGTSVRIGNETGNLNGQMEVGALGLSLPVSTEFWFKQIGTNEDARLYEGGTGFATLELHPPGGVDGLYLWNGGWLQASAGGTVPTATWFYCVITQTSASTVLYLNAVAQLTMNVGTPNPYDSTFFSLGRHYTGVGHLWAGLVDNLAVYNVALTGAQVAAHYLAAQTAPAPAAWPAILLA